MDKGRRKYRITFLNVDGHPLWNTEVSVMAKYDFYHPLVMDATGPVRCTIDSPKQEDKRAQYSLTIERIK